VQGKNRARSEEKMFVAQIMQWQAPSNLNAVFEKERTLLP
jgi:hypothetical protein